MVHGGHSLILLQENVYLSCTDAKLPWQWLHDGDNRLMRCSRPWLHLKLKVDKRRVFGRHQQVETDADWEE